MRSPGIRVGEQAHYPAVPSTSQILKADFALAQRAYQLAQEPRLYWVSLSTVSSSRAVEGVSQDESRLPPPTQPARPPPGYPHRFLKRRKMNHSLVTGILMISAQITRSVWLGGSINLLATVSQNDKTSNLSTDRARKVVILSASEAWRTKAGLRFF
jgi:hypothetical protein